jgi:hypothetical protein
MAASTQGDRLIREPPWNISCKAGFGRLAARSPPGIQATAVVGSIIVFTAVILVAGKPLISACLRMIASSLAR